MRNVMAHVARAVLDVFIIDPATSLPNTAEQSAIVKQYLKARKEQ
jgi:hypothetical protein